MVATCQWRSETLWLTIARLVLDLWPQLVRSSAATKEELPQWLQYSEDKTNTVTLDGECGGHRHTQMCSDWRSELIASASTASLIRVLRRSVRQRIATVEPSWRKLITPPLKMPANHIHEEYLIHDTPFPLPHSYKHNYTVSQKKRPTCKLYVTLSNLNGFSKFLHCWKAYKICYKNNMTLPTSP